MATSEYKKELVAWVRSLYGLGKRHRSARRLSLEAGRNPNAINTIEERGHATADLLADLARAAGVSPLEAFLHAGWITEEEMSATGESNLTSDEQACIQMYRETRPDLRYVAVGALQAAWQRSQGEEPSLRVAEPQAEYQPDGSPA